jgi:hypothetical protein
MPFHGSILTVRFNHGELDWVLKAFDDYFTGKLLSFPGGVLFMGIRHSLGPHPHPIHHPLSIQQILAAIGKIPTA